MSYGRDGEFRLSQAGRLTPARRLRFSFDGKTYSALEGDSVASALLAHGVHLAGRSFKYHRPRGIYSAGPEEPNVLVDVARNGAHRQPNVRATMQEVFDGARVASQNRWPSLAFDAGAIADLAAPLLPAGFYYKTFIWPRWGWKKLYEPLIRRFAGIGVAPVEADPDRYAHRHAHCDVLIVGGGLAGLAAALSAAGTGADVILAEERAEVGGALVFDTATRIDGIEGYAWARDAAARLKAMPNVRLLTRTTAFGHYRHGFVALAERVTDHLAQPGRDLPRERLWQVRAGRVIHAAGAIERAPVFAGNDRPGIMLASAARTYLNHYGVAVGRNVGVYTLHDSAYAAAFDLKRAGISVAAIVDGRRDVDTTLLNEAKALGIEVLTGHAVLATSGRRRISSLTVEAGGGWDRRRIAVDALIVSAGWTPSVHLFSQAGGSLRYDGKRQEFLPDAGPEGCLAVGACNGTEGLGALVTAAIAAGGGAVSITVENDTPWSGGAITAAETAQRKRGKAFVDFQHDVTADDIRLAVREGFAGIEHVKRFTTNGMAPDQGKLSNLNGLAITADALGRPLPEVGLTRFRPPYTPVTFGTLAGPARGALFDPVRRTPLHAELAEAGAVFEDVGSWKRAWFFPRAGEDMRAAVSRECRAVREAVGVFDASTLGKIEVAGPDAAAFLDLIYANAIGSLKPGRCRYGLMLREDGFIFDDGVVARLAGDRFHLTTTTGGAAAVLHHMEDYLQTEFPQLKVWLTSVTEQWVVIAVQGPKAREVLTPLVEGLDLSGENFPHMSIAEATILGVPARLFRVSFTGEVGFEVNVPGDYGAEVWAAIRDRAEAAGGTLYGTETMHVLRAEKGYIVVGQETDGTVTPEDAGSGRLVSAKKRDFVGIRGLKRPDLLRGDRKQLVGLLTKSSYFVLEEGAQVVADPKQAKPVPSLGHVTSAYWSENCGHSIALALISGGRSRIGEVLYVLQGERALAVEVTELVFFDREGSRIHG